VSALDNTRQGNYRWIVNLKKTLTTETVVCGVDAGSKQEIIEALVDICVKTGRVKDREAALKAVLEREKKMSTGMEHGVAIPHGKTEAVDDLVAAIAVSTEPVEFGCLDGLPARIFVMTLSPLHKSGPHLQFLAEVTQLLRDGERRRRVLSARGSGELLQAIIS
jgi:mannitol/fructose-specific phosphotransferase system IIA component (Ntr-type)